MENYIKYFDEFLKEVLKPLMKSEGFKTTGQHFFIESNEFTKLISIEKSSWNLKNRISFWFHVSIFDKTLSSEIGEFGQITKIPHNTVFNIIRTTVKHIDSRKSDRYTFSTEVSLENEKERVIGDLVDILIPFCRSINSKKDLLKIYKSPPIGYIGAGIFLDLAIGFNEIDEGNTSEGIKFLKKWTDENQNNQYWSNVVKKIESRIKEL
ncbi:MAG: DUF4304 domain-containing protein [Brumimicrobium sp.]